MTEETLIHGLTQKELAACAKFGMAPETIAQAKAILATIAAEDE
jgi:hypothetical protein